jgi:hypothetical protein
LRANLFESYNLPWYFAAFHTAHDSIEKRGKRGYLFTVGDEEAPRTLTREQIKRFLGDDMQSEVSTLAMLQFAQRSYDVYHVVIKEGSHARSNFKAVIDSWTPLLGQRLIVLEDHKKLAETIVSAIEVAEGVDAIESTKGWGGSAAIVHRAVKDLPRGRTPKLLGAA